MPKINEDSRGLFVELWKKSVDGVQFFNPAQVSMMTINPGSFRGNHYHNHLREHFILLEGDCEVITSLPVSEEDNRKYGWYGLSGNQRKMQPYEVVTIPTKFQHTFFSRKGAKVLIISDTEFDQQNPDTYAY
jgi:dTDP-4-dehydrorhamnose 3,5-epimerase-like enzyme